MVVLSCFPRKRSWLDGRSEGRGWGPGWELSLRALVVRPGSPSRWGRCICGAGPSVCGGLGAAYLCPGVLAPRPRPQRPPGPPAVGSGHCTQLGLSPFLWLQYRPFVFPFILLLLFIKPQKKLLARGIVRTEKREADAQRSTWPSSRPGPRAPRWPEQQIPGPALPTWGGRGCGQRGGRGDQVTAAGVPPARRAAVETLDAESGRPGLSDADAEGGRGRGMPGPLWWRLSSSSPGRPAELGRTGCPTASSEPVSSPFPLGLQTVTGPPTCDLSGPLLSGAPCPSRPAHPDRAPPQLPALGRHVLPPCGPGQPRVGQPDGH